MKKLKYGMVFLALVGIGVVSCEKENIAMQTNEQAQVENPDNDFHVRASGATRTWYDYSELGPPYGPYDYGCNSQPYDCFETVIVYISGASPIQDVFAAIESQVTTNIVTAFQTNYSLLSQNVSATYLDGVLNGTYSVRSKGDFSKEEAFMIFELNGVVAVYSFEKP